jgi:hypothetical protein
LLDIKAIRDDPESFRAGLARRNLSEAIDALLAADEQRRTLTARVEELRAAQNRSSKSIGGWPGPSAHPVLSTVLPTMIVCQHSRPTVTRLASIVPATPDSKRTTLSGLSLQDHLHDIARR